MLIVRIIGGLGNQLFQYSYGRYLAAQLDTDLYLDLAPIDSGPQQNYTFRQYSLKYFENIKATPIDNQLIGFLNHPNLIVRRLARYYNPFRFKYLHQNGLLPLKTPLNSCKDYYLNGYFVGFAHVEQMSKELVKEFSSPVIVNKQYYQLEKAIQAAPTPVFVHVRRGDYFTRHFDEFGICDQGYYARAIERMQALLPKPPNWFVFSDDADWVKTHLKLPSDTTYITDFHLAAHEDLMLMSRCQHGIISNSTFSWWGAWLIDRDDKLILCPDRWFKLDNKPHDYNAIVPASWQKIVTAS